MAEKDVATFPVVTLKSINEENPGLIKQLTAVSEIQMVRRQVDNPDNTFGLLSNDPKYFPRILTIAFPVVEEFMNVDIL